LARVLDFVLVAWYIERKRAEVRKMKAYIEKHPFIMIIVGVIGISMSSILVRYSSAPSALTAAWRLIWTVLLMTPVVFGKKTVNR
jgi:hypothetical protein